MSAVIEIKNLTKDYGEGRGISPAVAACATPRYRLPMAGGAESLNAAVAASIFMWEMSGRDRG